MTFSWLCLLFMNFSRLSDNIFMTFSWLSHDIRTCRQTPDKYKWSLKWIRHIFCRKVFLAECRKNNSSKYTALQCIVLYSTILWCTVMYCTLLFCGMLYSVLRIVSLVAAAQSTVPRGCTDFYNNILLHCIALYNTSLHCTVLQFFAPSCTALQSIAWLCNRNPQNI